MTQRRTDGLAPVPRVIFSRRRCIGGFAGGIGLVLLGRDRTVAAAEYKFVKQWGSLGAGDGEFNQPGGIAVGKGGDIYVADADNHRIQKFAPK